MQDDKKQFIQFLLENNVLQFGQFTLKSGRISPYFFNFGAFNTGAQLAKLGEFYAKTLEKSGFEYDVLFGPAYKGIPLVSTTAIALSNHHQKDIPYCFNRKEAKDHGEGGQLVGSPLQGNVVMVDDVITAGTAVHETLHLLEPLDATLNGILIAFDRQEHLGGSQTALETIQAKYNIPIASIVCLADLIDYLTQQPNQQQYLEAIQTYQTEFGIL